MKIAISGAGIAGTTLAYWLLRGGHEPILIERAPALRTGGYVIDFWGLGYTVAERMGILPEVRQAGYSVREVRMVDQRGRKVGGFSAEVFRRMVNDRFTSLPRGELATLIYRTIAGRVETILDNSIVALEERPGDVLVSLESGETRSVDLVVGADGLHSIVRELAFGPETLFERHLGYHVAAFEFDGYRPREELIYVSFALPGKQLARFALRGDRTLFLFVFVSELVPEAPPRDIDSRKALLHQVFNDSVWECPRVLQALDQVSSLYFDRVSQIRMDSWSKGRVILIGDAGACVSLLAGEGTGLAMTEAYVLAGELNRAGNDHRRAFQRYELKLRPFIEGKQESARNFASSFAPRTRPGIWFRNFVTRLLAVPPVANYFVGRGLRDNFELPDYETARSDFENSPEPPIREFPT